MNLEVYNLNEEELLKNVDTPDGLVLKNVPRSCLSSDVHTPMLPMRLTQPNIGLQLAKEDVADDRYGVSKEQYGGVGPKYHRDPKYRNVRRTSWHVRTGLHEEIAPPVTPGNRHRMVLKDKQFYASPIPEVGHDVFNTWYNYDIDKRPREVMKSLFPRSIVFELEYIKNENRKVMLAALDKERQAFEEKKMKKRSQNDDEPPATVPESVNNGAGEPCKSEPPFWWPDPSGRTIQHPPEPDTGDNLYTAMPKVPSIELGDVLQEMRLDDPQDYQPGEIHKGAKSPMELKKDGRGCAYGQWSPRNPNFDRPYDPSATPTSTPLQDHLSQLNQPQTKSESARNVQATAPTDPVDCKQPLGCQCRNKLVHRHLGQVATSTVWHPVIQPEKEDAAEVTAGGCMSVSNICGCHSFKQGQRTKTEKFQMEQYEFPYSETRYTPYEEKERQDELFKVGHPFRTMASRWMDANKDPLPSQPLLRR